MKAVDPLLCFRGTDNAGSDISVQFRVSEAEVLLIGPAAEPVDRRFFDQLSGQPELPPDRFDLLYSQMTEPMMDSRV